MPHFVEKQLAGLVFGYDYMIDTFNDYAEEHFNMKNPYEDEEGHRLRLPDHATKEDQKNWRKIQNQAWRHDKCFMGSCGFAMDCGLGMGPLVVLIPVIGPYVMYLVHMRSIRFVQKKYALPNKMLATLHSQILIDLLISLPPVIGTFLSWVHGCSTRNASLMYKYLVVLTEEKAKQQGTLPPPGATRTDPYTEVRQPQQAWLNKFKTNRATEGGTVVSEQESGVYRS